CREGSHVHVAGVERLDQALDGTALARRVPALEHDADRRSQLALVELATVDQPQVQQAALGPAEAFGLLVFGEALRKVAVLEAGEAVVMVALAVATVLVLAHVDCCSRSTMGPPPTRSPPVFGAPRRPPIRRTLRRRR